MVNQLRKETVSTMTATAQLPNRVTYNFDAMSPDLELSDNKLPVQKTRRRSVKSLQFGDFEAQETIRQEKGDNQQKTHRSKSLSFLVPKGHAYAYDLIAHVGIQTFLKGQKLTDVHQELAEQNRFQQIPFSSLYDVQRKFLFYLGERHKQASPQLNAYLHERPVVTWLIDGTVEPGTPVFFAAQESRDGMILGSWKIATENADDIARCLRDAESNYGQPDEILHDLSATMKRGVEIAFDNKVTQRVCNYHFNSDLGEDLYKHPQQLILQGLKESKLQPYLREYRRSHTERLRQIIKEKNVSLILTDLLEGKSVQTEWNDSLWRELLLALNFWLLDYASDGQRQGFPFDPFSLYFHRRMVKAHTGCERLLKSEENQKKAPKSFLNLTKRMNNYLCLPVIIKASALYEKAYQIFEGVRNALRLSAESTRPMHEGYDLHPKEQRKIKESLKELRDKFDEQHSSSTCAEEKKLYDIARTQLDKYWDCLLPTDPLDSTQQMIVRTTNMLETSWLGNKLSLRHMHGRKNLTREFQALPSEFILTGNLRIARYVELVMGDLDQLPEKLAEAGQAAPPYSHWVRSYKPIRIGQLPRRLLRKNDFLEDLFAVCENHCLHSLN